MLPAKNHPKWVPLVQGRVKTSFKVLSGNMMLAQCARKLEKDASPAQITACIDEVHAYFTKYEKVFGDELAALF